MKGRWLAIHRWVGLKLSILISFVMITGTFAVVSHEIDWLIDPARRVSPSQATDTLDWQAIYDAARTARPDWALVRIHAPLDPWHAAEIQGYKPTGEIARLLIHPTTFAFRAERPWFNAQRLFRDAHRRLMIPTWHGILIVSLLSIFLLVSLVSGLYVYKKFWRGFFKKPRTRDARTLWGDLHRLGGLWSLWFIVLIVFTSLFYLVEVLGMRADAFDPQTATAPPVQSGSLTAMAAQARLQLPDFQITSVALPMFKGDPVTFFGQSEAVLVRERANFVHFDAASGAMTGAYNAAHSGAWQRVSEAADPLHFGTFGGIWTKLLYFVFGCILSAMSLSGIYIYSKRMRKAARMPAFAAGGAAPLATPA